MYCMLKKLKNGHCQDNKKTDSMHVAILMGTCNGERFLQQQLDSIAAQTHTNWSLWISDDGSRDTTLSIISCFQKEFELGQVNLLTGPEAGFAMNFLHLVANETVDADYYAFSDQDDVWYKEKLARALNKLDSVPEHIPALYCSRTRLVNAKGKFIGLSPLFSKPPSFANALMQNIGGGNTMMFNRATRDLLKAVGMNSDVVTHDWLAYILVSGAGGYVVYDAEPCLNYRQHDANLVGMNATWAARIKRIRMLWQGRFRQWNDAHMRVLSLQSHRLTDKNRVLLEEFAQARHQQLLPRLIQLKKTGIHRQTLLGNLGLIVAAVFKRL